MSFIGLTVFKNGKTPFTSIDITKDIDFDCAKTMHVNKVVRQMKQRRQRNERDFSHCLPFKTKQRFAISFDKHIVDM